MARYSRRRFLQTSLATAAAAYTAPYIAFGQNANDKIAVAVVGVRSRGGNHIDAYLGDPRTEIQYVVDIDEKIGMSRAAKIAEKQGKKPKFVRDMREAFDDPSVNVVSTATPNHWHALCGVWAMQAGKDVYIEKPISHEIAEGSGAGRCRQEIRPDVPGGNAMPLEHGDPRRGRVHATERYRRSSDSPGGSATNAASRSARWVITPFPPKSISTSGPARLPLPIPRSRDRNSTTTGTGSGSTATATRATRARTRPTSLAGAWGSMTHPNSVISYGGRLGYQAETKDRQLRRRRRYAEHRSLDLRLR